MKPAPPVTRILSLIKWFVDQWGHRRNRKVDGVTLIETPRIEGVGFRVRHRYATEPKDEAPASYRFRHGADPGPRGLRPEPSCGARQTRRHRVPLARRAFLE